MTVFPVLHISENFSFSIALQNWYAQNKRELPWRETTDPYQIWLSEIILQQTRVAQGLPYFKAFVSHFPSVEKLADASEHEVLRVWQGLGYYSRARNLHACAREITNNRDGNFPKNYKGLLELKGVGTYTAAAIASFAFKEAVAVVDGNVTRVLSRVFGIEHDTTTSIGRKSIAELAQSLLDHSNPDIHNQAIMEFGALHCTPIAPACSECLIKESCFAYKNDMQKELPFKTKKIKIKERHLSYLVIEYKQKLLLKKRSHDDIWKGLYDFYLIEEEGHVKPEFSKDGLVKLILSNNHQFIHAPQVLKHKLTHQKIWAYFHYIEIIDDVLAQEILKLTNFTLYTLDEILSLPKPILIHNYLFKKLILLN